MHTTFLGLSTDHVRTLQAGGLDANGQKPERAISDGEGVPCRHCLTMIQKDDPYLILANRPFVSINPYAEVGPIFLHANNCSAYSGPNDVLPPVLNDSPDFIVRGYSADERIVYGTGGVVARETIVQRASELLDDPSVRFVHVRSARNNCWQARIEASEAN